MTLLFACVIGSALAGPVVKRHHVRHEKDQNRSKNIKKTLDMLIRDLVDQKPSKYTFARVIIIKIKARLRYCSCYNHR